MHAASRFERGVRTSVLLRCGSLGRRAPALRTRHAPSHRFCGTTSAVNEASSSSQKLVIAAAAVVAVPAVVFIWMKSNQTEVDIQLTQVSEEVFDHSDNLFVFFFDAAEDLQARREDVQSVVRALKAEQTLQRLKFYYNVRKEGDPVVPDGVGASADVDGRPALRVIVYKGQRKTVLRVCPSNVDISLIQDFFSPVSEDLAPSALQEPVPRVAGAQFAEHIVKASSAHHAVLLQMYEDTCFLCFLMRPFMNSLARLFKENDVPVTIKRLNLERNDFPDACPVARGTPTFVLFRGQGTSPIKLEEFKPKDLCERLTREFPQATESIFERMDELQGLVSRRFQMFSQVVMWTVELQKLERLCWKARPAAGDGGDVEFGEVVGDMMAKDMKRKDEIPFNLDHLRREIEEAEHDAIVAGMMVAERLLQREAAAR